MAQNTYIFGIGGTGARVIRSLTMLLASGVKLKNTGKVIPILIDVDAQNGDTNRTIRALKLYKDIRRALYGDESSEKANGFYAADLNTMGSVNVANTKPEDSFLFKFDSIAETFYNYIKAGELQADDIELLKLLYDSSEEYRPETELNLKLTVGFKGNPNIGSVVFNDLENTEGYKYFRNAKAPDDRIFIVSSIFGGTGSAGFPQLLKMLRSDTNTNLSKSVIGAITLMPYFNVQESGESAIVSANFLSKTKAALSYYEKEMKALNALYYLYDKPGDNPYSNQQGGQLQENAAHIAELLAATAAIDFINKDSFGSNTQYYEYGIKHDADPVNVTHFHDKTRENIMVPLTKFKYYAKLFTQFLPEQVNNSKMTYIRDLRLNENFRREPFYDNQKVFLTEHFYKWLEELGRNKRAFQPFDLLTDFNSMVRGRVIETRKVMGIGDGGLDTAFFENNFNQIQENLNKEGKIPETQKRFMKVMQEVAEKAFTEKLKGLPAV